MLDASAGEWDQALVLGDLVGYGADPNAVDRSHHGAAGGDAHPRQSRQGRDAASTRVDSFNHLARQAIEWTARVAHPGATTRWLAALPQGRARSTSYVEICHGSPCDEDVYIFDDLDVRARRCRSRRPPLCLFGHTHVPERLPRRRVGRGDAADSRRALPGADSNRASGTW